MGGGRLMQVTMFYIITKSIGALTPGSLNGSYCPGPGPTLPKREACEMPIFTTQDKG